MRLADEKVEEVRQAIDIVEVVSEHVRLKRQGARFVGLCPFHKEKSPSFSVDPKERLFYCFGCHRGGDAITFVRDTEGVGFFEAVRALAERFNVPLPEAEEGQDAERASRQEAVLHALRWAGRWFYGQLTKTPEGERGLQYLMGRGLTPETIKGYGLGYAPERWDALVRAAEAAGISGDVLVDAGLAIRRDRAVGGNAAGSLYDRYRGRVVFPIFSHTGRVIGFGGRLMTDAKDQPKYVNSPETPVYSKSRVLYGLYQGRQEIRRQEEALLVEGYLDVLALHQAGFLNAVATCGTALTPEQVTLVSRFAKRLVLVYDGDNAGRTAAVKGAETVVANWRVDPADEKATREAGVGELLRKGLVVYAVSLPAGEDPDSFVRDHGGEAFKDYLHKQRQDFVAFAYRSAEQAGRLASPEGRAEVQGEILRTIAHLQHNPLLRESYLKRAAEVLGVPLPVLAEALAVQQRAVRSRPADEEAPPEEEAPEGVIEAPPEALPPEEELIRLMLEGGEPLVEFVLGRMGLDEFSDGPVRDLAAALIAQYEAGRVSKEAFTAGQHGAELQRLTARVLASRATLSQGWKEQGVVVGAADPYEAAASAMTLLKLRRVDDALDAQKAALRAAAEGQGDLEAAQRRLMALLDLRKRIEARAFLEEG
jgi:DNA primase